MFDADDVSELQQLLLSSTRPRVRALLEERIRSSAPAAPPSASAPSSSAPAPSASVSIPTLYASPHYGWEQESQFVSVILFDLPGVSAVKELVQVVFTPRSFSITIPAFAGDGRAYALKVPVLDKEIDPARSSFKVKKNSVELKLKKKGEYDHWMDLEAKKGSAALKEKADDPSAGINDMMKQMYDEGTPEMKKIIAESMMKSQNERLTGARGGGAKKSDDFDSADFGAGLGGNFDSLDG